MKRLKSRMYTTEDGAMGEGGVTCGWWFSILVSQSLTGHTKQSCLAKQIHRFML